MYIEIVDSLRCPAPHEETWLVASVSRIDGRDIVEGLLGCPVCRRQYEVRRGEVDFGSPSSPLAPTGGATAVTTPGALEAAVDGDAREGGHDESAMLRARALLGLTDGGGLVLLGGRRGIMAQALEDEAQVTTLLLNAPASAWHSGRVPSAIRAVDVLPLAAGALRAAWLDTATATVPTLVAVARALRPGGRLVAPIDAPLPPGARELARDAAEWVAEWDGAASAPVSLRRR